MNTNVISIENFKKNEIAKKIMIACLVLLSAGILYTLIMHFSEIQQSISNVNVTVSSDGKLSVDGGGMNYANSGDAMTSFLAKYKTLVVGISGIGAVSMIAFFIFNFLKLGATATNPSERTKVLTGLVWSALAAAGLGAVSIIVGFFYNSLT